MFPLFVLACLLVITGLLSLFRGNSAKSPSFGASTSWHLLCSSHPTNDIPNIVHYAYFLSPDPEASLNFAFKEFASIYSAIYYYSPLKVYIHINASLDSLNSIRNHTPPPEPGSTYFYTHLILNHPLVTTNFWQPPLYAPHQHGTGVKINALEHSADFLRSHALHKYGGIDHDWDGFPLRDIAPLRSTGYQSVFGREEPLGEGQPGLLNVGIMLSQPHSPFIRLFEQMQYTVYDGG